MRQTYRGVISNPTLTTTTTVDSSSSAIKRGAEELASDAESDAVGAGGKRRKSEAA